MELQTIVDLLVNNGTVVCVLAYCLWRDAKFMQKLENTLSVIESTIDKIEKRTI